ANNPKEIIKIATKTSKMVKPLSFAFNLLTTNLSYEYRQ
ncbi:unnamed protein product, partial [marine sediment metagenome]